MADPSPSQGPTAQFFNVAQVRSTTREFFLDLFQVTGRRISPGEPTEVPLSHAILISAVVTTPGHAKALMEALKSHIERFEKQNGPITESRGPAEDVH